MKNAWKGLVLGGLTGVAAGILLDALDRGAREVNVLGDKLAHQAPEVAGRLRDAVTDAVAESASRVRDPELAEHVKEISGAARKRAGEVIADSKGKASEVIADSKGKASEVIADSKGKASEVTADSKERLESAIAEGKSKAKAAAHDAKGAVGSARH